MSRKPTTQEQQNNGRNEYIPSYISKAPFYAQGLSDSDYLDHQRLTSTSQDTLDKAKWYERGKKSGPAATKYRKGACENCGAMTHKTKDCLERPRKIGAKWTGKDIQADEVVDEVTLGWDAKRDRWNGYDPREYAAVIQEHEELEALRRANDPKASEKLLKENGEGGTNANDDSEVKYAEETDMGRGQSNGTRQLRLREDTAKYLLNLDLDSAKYDPKTRSMDTTSQTLSNNPDAAADDGFVRPASTLDDAAAFERAQRYAWETQESNNARNSGKLHLQANPTEGEVLLKKRQNEEAERKASQRKLLSEKYGDQSAVQQKPKMATTSTESYIEYDLKTGKPKAEFAIIKAKPRSKYPEDVLTNNHTSVWGSWWSDFQWGYACCHSTTKNSYCTGDQGRLAFEEAENLRTGRNLIEDAASISKEPPSSEVHKSEPVSASRSQSQVLEHEQNGDDVETRKPNLDADTSLASRSTAKRPYHHFRQTDADEEQELESYKRNKLAADDPMRTLGHLNADGVIDR